MDRDHDGSGEAPGRARGAADRPSFDQGVSFVSVTREPPFPSLVVVMLYPTPGGARRSSRRLPDGKQLADAVAVWRRVDPVRRTGVRWSGSADEARPRAGRGSR